MKKVVKRKVQDAILTSFTLFTSLRNLVGLERPTNWFGRGIALKTGVVPAQHRVLPAPKSEPPWCASSSDRDTS